MFKRISLIFFGDLRGPLRALKKFIKVENRYISDPWGVRFQFLLEIVYFDVF